MCAVCVCTKICHGYGGFASGWVLAEWKIYAKAHELLFDVDKHHGDGEVEEIIPCSEKVPVKLCA